MGASAATACARFSMRSFICCDLLPLALSAVQFSSPLKRSTITSDNFAAWVSGPTSSENSKWLNVDAWARSLIPLRRSWTPTRRKTVEESACISGYDAHKCVKGRKRHLLVDTLGLPISVYVTTADMHDTQGARRLLAGLKYACSIEEKKVLGHFRCASSVHSRDMYP